MPRRADNKRARRPRKPYTPPRLTEYGDVSKLTLTGGATHKDVAPEKKLGVT